MQLKTFLRKLTELEALEEEVNRWVEMNPDLQVMRTGQEVFENPRSKATEVLLCVWYVGR